MNTWSKLGRIIHTWADLSKQLITETYALYLAYQDRRTPWYARVVAATVVAYAFSPVDLIPDFIPALGYLDDVILVPAGIFVALKLIPPPVLAECRQRARQDVGQSKQTNCRTAVVIITIWLLMTLAGIFIFYHVMFGVLILEQKTTGQKNNWLFVGFWSLLTGLGGFLIWKGFGYSQRLLRQPYLKPNILPTGLKNYHTLEAKALLIASANLQAGIEERRLHTGQEKLVLCAGIRNFREPWARDLSFTSFGLIELGEFQAAKEAFEVFLINQRRSGQFPVKVHSTSVLDRYFHSLFKREQPNHASIKPKYMTAHNTISLDGNAILVIAMFNYASRANDDAFVNTHWSALKQALVWLETRGLAEDGLLHQAAFADWADSIARRGRVLYTNVLYWKALRDLADVASEYGYVEDQIYFNRRAQHLKETINDHFWREDLGYYVTNQIFDNLSSSGNLLAIAWDLTRPEQANAILDKMSEFQMADPVPTRVTYRPYPDKFIALENRLGGIANYHASAAW